MDEISINQINSKGVSALKLWKGYEVFEALLVEHPKIEIFLAGGAIRDLLAENENQPKDFDFFLGGNGISSFLNELKRFGILEKGPFGSPRWFPNDCNSQYADVIVIENFYNGLWSCKDIVDVLNQFDITVNAIAIDLRKSFLHDPQNGIRDIMQQVIKAVRFDYPDEPISMSYSISRLSVLWHRIQYYAKKTGFQIEPVTNRWLLNNMHFMEDKKSFQEIFHLQY